MNNTDITVRKSTSDSHGIDKSKSDNERQLLVKKCNEVQGVKVPEGLFTQIPITLNAEGLRKILLEI